MMLEAAALAMTLPVNASSTFQESNMSSKLLIFLPPKRPQKCRLLYSFGCWQKCTNTMRFTKTYETRFKPYYDIWQTPAAYTTKKHLAAWLHMLHDLIPAGVQQAYVA